MQEKDTQLTAIQDSHKTIVPGKLRWFEKGSPDYQKWVAERDGFMKEIEPDNQSGKNIINDIVDGILESEIPSGLMSAFSTAMNITKKAREKRKRKQQWYNVVDTIIQLTFTAPEHPDNEFVFGFDRIQNIWRATAKEDLPFSEYRNLYSTVDIILSAGRLKNVILKYPVLNQYIEYKLREFKQSYHDFELFVLGLYGTR